MNQKFEDKKLKKIKVVHYCNQLSLGGTEKTMELFCKYLNKDIFDVFVVSKKHNPKLLEKFRVYFGLTFRHPVSVSKIKNWRQMFARLPNFEKILNPKHVLIANNDNDLKKILLELKPDILHIHYSGIAEPPITFDEVMNLIPVTVTTNVFEIENKSKNAKKVKKIFLVSNWLREKMAKWSLQDSRVEIMYNPCEKPLSNFNLRDKLKIPHNAFVIGRVGRPDDGVYDPISILAYKEIETHNTYFLALSPPPKMIEDAKKLNLKNFIALNYIVDEVEMSKFYNTIDVLAHARRDGETFGCNLAEAMIHAKPCVSHLTDEMNGQVETIGDGGVVVEKDDVKSYAQALKKLLEDKKYYEELSRKAKKRAIENFDAETLTKRLEKIYLKLLE